MSYYLIQLESSFKNSHLVWWQSEVEVLLHIGSGPGTATAIVKSSLEPSQKTVSETIAPCVYLSARHVPKAREMSLLKSFLYGSVPSVFLTTARDKECSQASTDRRMDKEVQSVVCATLEMPDVHHSNKEGRRH